MAPVSGAPTPGNGLAYTGLRLGPALGRDRKPPWTRKDFFFGGGGLTFTHIWRLAIGESVPGPATSNFNFKVSRLVIKSYPLGDG